MMLNYIREKESLFSHNRLLDSHEEELSEKDLHQLNDQHSFEKAENKEGETAENTAKELTVKELEKGIKLVETTEDSFYLNVNLNIEKKSIEVCRRLEKVITSLQEIV